MKVSCVLVLLCIFGAVYCQGDELRPCTPDDIYADYTTCKTLDGTRNLLYFTSADCQGGTEIPNRITGLPCNVDCDPGEYLPYGAIRCSVCPEGTFSLGGGAYVTYWNDTFPRSNQYSFQTYCAESNSVQPNKQYGSDCGWVLDGFDVRTMDMRGKSEMNVILELGVTILQEQGEVTFTYIASAEFEGDRFGVMVDGEKPVNVDLSETLRSKTIYLDAGLHVIHFILYKNPEISNGNEIVRIADVSILGLNLADDGSCTECPPGYYQSEFGASECLQCPANTYSSSYGSTTCESCVGGYSLAGSAHCTDYERTCSSEIDASLHSTECMRAEDGSWYREVHYEWNEPLFCDTTGIELSEPEVTDCLPCPKGHIISQQENSRCEICPDGTYSSSLDSEKCHKCSAGTAALRILTVDSWDSLPDYFTTKCYGDCADDGWQSMSSSIRASHQIGQRTQKVLTVRKEFGYNGGFQFEYTIVGESLLQVFVDNKIVLKASDSDNERAFFEYYFEDTGLHRIDLIGSGDEEVSGSVDIHYINLIGSGEGGAEYCSACPKGTYQSDSRSTECVACPAGHYSDSEGSTGCHTCPKNTYMARNGAEECIPCPEGTTSNSGRLYCANPTCTFTTNNGKHSYNLSPFANYPQFAQNDGRYPGHYQVSYCGPLPEVSEELPCGPDYMMCETFNQLNPYDAAVPYLKWGTDATFAAMSDSEDGFELWYTGGEKIGGCDGGRGAIVRFNCDMENSSTQLTLNEDESNECLTVLELDIIYGCAVCTTSDFHRREGECKDGKMEVSFEKKDKSVCNGSIKSITEDCGDVSIGLGLLIIICVVILMAIVVLLFGILWVCMKNRRLKVKYTQLQAGNVEMDDMPGDIEME